MSQEHLKSEADTLLESHEFTLSCAEESGLTNVGFTDEHKKLVAERIIEVLKRAGLSLDYNVPRVRLVILKQTPSEATYEGLQCLDLEGKVFIFTNDGPKNFTWNFGVLKPNESAGDSEVKTAPDEQMAAQEPIEEKPNGVVEKILAQIRKVWN